MIINGDARSIPLADESVQCVVTSPPYWGLRDYGVAGQIGLESTPDEYVTAICSVFAEVRRVLRPDGTCWLNLGDSYAGSGAVAGGEWKQSNTGSGGTWSGGAASTQRRHYPPCNLKPKDLVGIPWRIALALQASGWWLRSDIIWAKPNPMPESVTDRPTRSHEYLFLLTKSARYYYDAAAITEKATCDRMRGTHDYSHVPGGGDNSGLSHGVFATRNRRSVWTIATQSYTEAHFATFPEKLVEPCVLAGSRPGDVVLDPFAGSGTVGKVCARFGREFVGIELNPAYVGLAKKRVSNVQITMDSL